MFAFPRFIAQNRRNVSVSRYPSVCLAVTGLSNSACSERAVLRYWLRDVFITYT